MDENAAKYKFSVQSTHGHICCIVQRDQIVLTVDVYPTANVGGGRNCLK